MRRTATVLSGSACCVYGLTFTSHFYGARRTVGYVPFDSETLVTGKLFEDIRESVHDLADPEKYDAVVVINLCVPTASGVPLDLLPKEINGVRIIGIDVPGFDHCFSSKERLDFAKGIDYLVSILPKTAQTDGIISEALIEQLAPDSTVINVGRGNAIDESALRSGFDNGKLKAAVLDVFDIEPLPQDHWYWAHDRVFVTSHTAAPTPSSAVITVFARNLRLFLAGQPFDTVDPAKGY